MVNPPCSEDTLQATQVRGELNTLLCCSVVVCRGCWCIGGAVGTPCRAAVGYADGQPALQGGHAAGDAGAWGTEHSAVM
jgi:hypothetical protein